MGDSKGPRRVSQTMERLRLPQLLCVLAALVVAGAAAELGDEVVTLSENDATLGASWHPAEVTDLGDSVQQGVKLGAANTPKVAAPKKVGHTKLDQDAKKQGDEVQKSTSAAAKDIMAKAKDNYDSAKKQVADLAKQGQEQVKQIEAATA